MKAAIIRRFGPPEVLEYADVPEPSPRPGHIVIKVLACGINRYDTFLRLGAIAPDLTFPHVMGADISGVIHELGPGISGWAVGERVIVAPGFPTDPAEWTWQPENFAPSYAVTGTRAWGGYAQFVNAPAPFVLHDHTALTPAEMACIPLVLVTAMHAVDTLGRAGPGMHVLVQAGASGSGSMCVQVAAALGAHVATTVGSAEKIDMAAQAGAELVINRSESDFVARTRDWTGGRGVDLVIDNIGGDTLASGLRCLSPGGTLVNFGALGGTRVELDVLHLLFQQLAIRGSKMGSMEELRKGLALVEHGKLRPTLDQVFPLQQARQAHEYMEARRVRGKIVLLPWKA